MRDLAFSQVAHFNELETTQTKLFHYGELA